MDIEFLYFDVANTLLHKPSIWPKIEKVLHKYGYQFNIQFIKQRHKIVSECIKFPDKTSQEFYTMFNSHFLLSLGVIPTDQILSEIFEACDNQPWARFEDDNFLQNIEIPVGIMSNWDLTLRDRLKNLFDISFRHVVVSAEIGVAKPSPEFFQKAIEHVGTVPEKIGFVGDSIKLDIMPAMEIGMQPILVDRDDAYPNFKFKKVRNFNELSKLFK